MDKKKYINFIPMIILLIIIINIIIYYTVSNKINIICINISFISLITIIYIALPKQLTDKCKSDVDCVNVCVDKKCVECGKNTDCRSGKSCVGNRCV